MTLLPSTDFGIVGVKGGHYDTGNVCAVPGCVAGKDDTHHIFRRSGLGNVAWVELPDGRVIGNLTALCRRHHDGVTGQVGGHEFWIKLIDGQYVWGLVVGLDTAFPEFAPLGPLDPQPPARESLDVSQPATEPEPDRCPSCGQQKRRSGPPARSTPGARRRRKSWLIKVPDDHEDGALVLDTLVDDLAPLLGYDAEASTRYHTVAAVLVYAQQDKRSFVKAVAGVGGQEE